MTEHFLRRKDIAAMLDTTPGVAASVLAEHGVYPVDFGRGAGRGPRWLESAVKAAMQAMHEAAQPKPRPVRKQKTMTVRLSDMSVNDVYRLTTGQCVQ